MVIASSFGVAIAAPALVDWIQYKDQIRQVLSSQLGRAVEFDSLEVEPSLPPLVRIRGLRVANAEWGEAPHLMTVDELRIRVDILQLVQGDTVIPELIADAPRIWLERDAAGQVNWTLEGSSGGGGGGLPVVIRDLRVTDGHVAYDDRTAGLALRAELTSITGRMPEQEGVTLEAKGSLAGRPLELRLDGASVARLRDTEQAFPFEGRVALADTEAAIDGGLRRPRGGGRFEAHVHLDRPTLATLGLDEVPVPDSPPYSLDGTLSRDGATWRLGELEASLGESRVTGWSEVDLSGARPMVRADLVASVLRYADLEPLAGSSSTTEGGGLVPDTELPAELLHAADADLHLRVERSEFPVGPLGSVEGRVVLRDGRAEARPLRVDFGGGTIRGEVALNARSKPPSADADLTLEQLPLKLVVGGTRFAQETSGRLRGDLYLLGSGTTLDELVNTLTGHLALAMSDGTLSALAIEAAGLDLAETLLVFIEDDARVPIRCAVADLDVEDGTAHVRRLMVDTQDSVIRGQGTIGLGREILDLRLEAQGKDFSPLDPDAPIFVRGTFQDPAVSVGAGVAIPLVELGLTGDAPCERLTREVLTQGERAGRSAGEIPEAGPEPEGK